LVSPDTLLGVPVDDLWTVKRLTVTEHSDLTPVPHPNLDVCLTRHSRPFNRDGQPLVHLEVPYPCFSELTGKRPFKSTSSTEPSFQQLGFGFGAQGPVVSMRYLKVPGSDLNLPLSHLGLIVLGSKCVLTNGLEHLVGDTQLSECVPNSTALKQRLDDSFVQVATKMPGYVMRWSRYGTGPSLYSRSLVGPFPQPLS